MDRNNGTEAHASECTLSATSKMQSQRPVPAEPPAELALIKELVSTTSYKFLLPAAQNKLTSIKQLTLWFLEMTKMLDRFPEVELFLFGTVAALNNGADLQLKTVSIKKESSLEAKAERPGPSPSALQGLVKEELRIFGPVTTWTMFDRYLGETSYKQDILDNADLKHVVAPTLFPPSEDGRAILSKTLQYKSPEYEETVTLSEQTGLTLVSDTRTFVFPSEQRRATARAVTFHYVRGDKKLQQESRIHQLLRPHLWRWIVIALTGTDFAYLLALVWECDHSSLFQKLITQEKDEREESDQLFAILKVIDELRTKSQAENLMTWYVNALKTIEDVNAVTRTFSKSSLFLLPVEFAECMYKVHAHKEGYSEVMSRVSRDNDGYMPILKLQKAIKLISVDKNRQKSYSNFEAGKNHKARAITPQVTSTSSAPGAKFSCCYKFLEGKCQDDNCVHPHVKVPVPAGVCALYLADKISCSGCGKQHERWGSIIKKINEGLLPQPGAAKPSKSSHKKKDPKKKQVNTTTAPPAPQTKKGGDSGRGGRGKGRDGGRGGKGTKDSTKGGKGGTPTKPDVICSRCAKPGHEFAGCWASNHADGHKLTCPKPAPIPEKYAKKAVNSVSAKRPWYMEPPEEGDDDESSLAADRTDYEYIEEDAYWPEAQVNVLTASSPRHERYGERPTILAPFTVNDYVADILYPSDSDDNPCDQENSMPDQDLANAVQDPQSIPDVLQIEVPDVFENPPGPAEFNIQRTAAARRHMGNYFGAIPVGEYFSGLYVSGQHWDLREAFTRHDLDNGSDSGGGEPPPLEYLTSTGHYTFEGDWTRELKVDSDSFSDMPPLEAPLEETKTNNTADYVEELFISPLVAPPSFILQKDDLNWAFCASLGLGPNSSPEPPLARGGRQ